MRGILESAMWASTTMIPDSKARQPRDRPMQCGNQPADLSVIHRRYKLRASRVGSVALLQPRRYAISRARRVQGGWRNWWTRVN